MTVESIYCPSCFRRVAADTPRCPHCTAILSDLDRRSYRERLITALNHPLAEVRMRAIIALGLRRQVAAVNPLLACAFRSRRRRRFLSVAEDALHLQVHDQRPQHGAGIVQSVVEVVDHVPVVRKPDVFQLIGIERPAGKG